jgi:acyl-CoA synthetase (AMP-forming)/AMP-acid ligase II
MRLLPHGLLESAARDPAASAIRRGADSLCYGDLARRAESLAGHLRDAGLSTGDRVALLFESGPDYALCCHGAWLAGAAVLGLNAAARADELARVVAHAECGFLIVDGAHPEAAGLVAAVGTGVRVIARDAARLGARATDLALAVASAGHAKLPALDPAALASLIYTSGTTGSPKAVMLSHGNLAANADAIIQYLELRHTDSMVCVLPFHYSYGASVLNTHLMVGARLTVEPNLVFPHRVVEAMAQEKCTGFAGVPSTFALLAARVALERYDLSSLRYITQAGGGMSPTLTDRVRAAFPAAQLFVMYGQTEASARLTWLPPARLDDKRGSVGQPIAGVTLQIRDEAGRIAATGESGEIWVQGPNVMLGYWKDPDATARTLVDGWLRTGDHGHLDAEGFLFIDGRRNDIIKVGAHRVHPQDIEHAIEALAGVAEVAVVAEDDPVLGQVVKACIVRSPGAEVTAEAVKAHCRSRLAAYKIPKTVEFVPSLPRTASGKLRRHLVSPNPHAPAGHAE